MNAASAVCFVFEQLCGEAFLRTNKLALFFSPLFTNNGIFLHLYLCFICIGFISVSMLNFIATFKGLYFHTFLHFTFHLPISTCIGLHTKMYFLMK